MKKRLLSTGILVAITVLIGTMYSCSKNNESPISLDEQTAINELNADLENLNATYNFENYQTKGNWWKWMFVGLGDAACFFLSGGGTTLSATSVTVAISGSTAIYKLFKLDKDKDSSSDDAIIGDSSLLPGQESLFIGDEIWGAGEIHNKVICLLYEEYGESLFQLSNAQLLNVIEKKTAEVLDCDISEARLPEDFGPDTIFNIANAFMESNSSKEFICRLCNLYPEKAQVLDVLLTATVGFDYISEMDEVEEYSKAVCDIIESSTVEKPLKEELVETISVANASRHLWNTEKFINK